MTRTTLRVLASIGTLTLVATACGDSNSGNEAALERLIENETGEDIDLDLDGDGGFSLETEDGGFSINVDEEGNVQFDGDEGSGSFDADGEGGGDFTFEGSDGEGGTVEIDGDGDGGFTVTDDDGQTVLVQEGDDGGGTLTVTGDDGEATIQSGPGIPSQWPSDIPQPEGLTDINGSFFAEGDDVSMVVSGTPTDSGAEFLARYALALSAAGFAEMSTFDNGNELAGYNYERDGVTLNAVATDLGPTTQVTIAVARS